VRFQGGIQQQKEVPPYFLPDVPLVFLSLTDVKKFSRNIPLHARQSDCQND